MISFLCRVGFFFSWKCGRYVHKYLSGLARRLGIIQGFDIWRFMLYAGNSILCKKVYPLDLHCTMHHLYGNNSPENTYADQFHAHTFFHPITPNKLRD